MPPKPPRKPASPPEKQLGLSMILYGPPGYGKTSFVANFPNTGFIVDSQEQGVRYLLSRKLIPEPIFITEVSNRAASWEPLIKTIYQAAASEIDTLVLESLTGFEAICFLYHAKEQFSSQAHPDGDISSADSGFYSYYKGPKNAARFDWPQFIEACQAVLNAGKNVIITGHSMVKEETSPEGVKYLKNVPVAEKEVWARLARWASIVACMSVRIQADTDKNRGALKKVARPDMDRVIFVESTPYAEAKNWYGLQGVIPCGRSGAECYTNFMRALMV